MLKIQVLGKGLVPRGYGLAPIRTPFPADRTLIHTILATPGLSIKYLNPTDNQFYDLTRQNCQQVWNKYANVKAKAPAPAAKIPTPSVPPAATKDVTPPPATGCPTGEKGEPGSAITPPAAPAAPNKTGEPTNEEKVEEKNADETPANEAKTTIKPFVNNNNSNKNNNKK